MRKIILNFLLCLLLQCVCFADTQLLKTDDLTETLSAELRTDFISSANTVDLDNKIKTDDYAYLAYEYSFKFDLRYKETVEFFLKFETIGPGKSDAPLLSDKKILNYTGYVGDYQGAENLPRIREYWMDSGLPYLPIRFKGGLFRYSVGKGLTSGFYENYGITLYNENDKFKGRFHYEQPDLTNRIILGPHIKQEKLQGIDYQPNAANLYAFDMEIPFSKKNSIWPYLILLVDRTSDGKRTRVFDTPTDKDMLGTFGFNLNLNLNNLSFGFETARNFGKAVSSDDNFPDVEHKGFLVYADSSYDFGFFSPRMSVLVASGNKVTEEDFSRGSYLSKSNKAFSVYSPMNINLSDSVYPYSGFGPLVAMGNGYGLNNGVPRPTTFDDPYLPENIIMPNAGIDFIPTDKLKVSLDLWFLKSYKKGWGSFLDAKGLDRGVGKEFDLFVNYDVNRNFNLSLFGGYFVPGNYYKESRDDMRNVFSPLVRGDGEADDAWQLELSATVTF